MRPGSASRVLWMLVIAASLSGGCGGPSYDTPEATFQTAKSAVAGYDCQTFCGCLTTEARDHTVAKLVIYGSSLQSPATGPAEERIRVRAERIKAVLEKHGCQIQTAFDMIGMALSGSEQRKHQMLKLIEPIQDRNGFIGDFVRVLIETAEDSAAALIEPDARLLDLHIDGDTATATFAQTREGQEQTDPIEFRKIDGKWKISRLPRLIG